MTHLRAPGGTVLCEHEDEHRELLAELELGAGHDDHSHSLIDRSILRSRAGVRAVAASLLILGITAA